MEKKEIVLILVLMEDTLRGSQTWLAFINLEVLILVLMEDTLRDTKRFYSILNVWS